MCYKVSMDEAKAREILKSMINEAGDLYCGSPAYVRPYEKADLVLLDGDFTADELEAIAWWMRNISTRSVR
jgi:hypothetical protein